MTLIERRKQELLECIEDAVTLAAHLKKTWDVNSDDDRGLRSAAVTLNQLTERIDQLTMSIRDIKTYILENPNG